MSKRGETRRKIIHAAMKIFFEYGYEAASVKMIIEEAGVVTGSFYHFFPSKEILFEEVIREFTAGHVNRLTEIFGNDRSSLREIEDACFKELAGTSERYFELLHGDRFHWTIQSALKERSLILWHETLRDFLKRRESMGTLVLKLDVDHGTLAMVLLKGSEAIVQGCKKYTEEIRDQLIAFWDLLIGEA